MNLLTDTQLAEQFGITTEKLHELRKRYHWPHVRLGRFDVRFTEDQVAHIVAQHSHMPAEPATRATIPVAGQTARSASRRRSA